MAIEIRFIFALLVSLEFVINVNELPFFSKQELLAMRRKYQGLLYGMRGNITIVFNLKRGESDSLLVTVKNEKTGLTNLFFVI